MFEIGFPELLLILFVGLVVVGPDKLPQIIKSTTRALRNLTTYFNEVRSQIEKSMGMDEIRQDLHNEKIMENLKEDKKSESKSTKK